MPSGLLTPADRTDFRRNAMMESTAASLPGGAGDACDDRGILLHVVSPEHDVAQASHARSAPWGWGAARALGGLGVAGLFGATSGWCLAAFAGARGHALGLAGAPWRESVAGPGLVAVAALAASFCGGRRSRALLGALVAAAVVASAVGWLATGEAGSAPVLVPALAALGGMLGSARPMPGGVTGALLSAASAAGVILAWPEIAQRTGAHFALVSVPLGAAAVLLTTALVLGFGDTPTGELRSARIWRGALALLAAAATWWCTPAGVWSGAAGPAVAALAAVGLLQVALALASSSRWLQLAAVVLPAAIPWFERTPGFDPHRFRVIAANGAATAVYSRADQELQLWYAGRLVDGEGPDRPAAELTATVVRALAAPGDRVLLLGLGTGRLPAALAGEDLVVDTADGRPEAAPLRQRLAGAGPVAAPVAGSPPAILRRVAGPAAFLAALPAGARQVLVVEPLTGDEPEGTTPARQAELRRVAGAGLVVQPFALDRCPAGALHQLFASAAAVHPNNMVLAVGEVGLLLSSGAAPVWPDEATFDRWPDAARWRAHAAHLGSAADLQRACLGTVSARLGATGDPVVGGTGRAAVLDVLRRDLEPLPPLADDGEDSVLLSWTRRQAGLRALRRELEAADGGAAAQARAHSAALRYLPCGAPAAFLQAALGLPDEAGTRLMEPAAASLAAQAMDPTFFQEPWAAVFGCLPLPREATGALEDLADLPPPERLAGRCAGDSPLAKALRARFPSPCAHALVQSLAVGPLPAAGLQALRELADPFVLDAAARALAGRGAVRELLGLWRLDLPLPEVLRELSAATAEDRRLVLEALPGRRDPGSVQLLAEALCDGELPLRRAAARALSATFGDKVAYDPEWPRTRLLTAAEQVRKLHHRTP